MMSIKAKEYRTAVAAVDRNIIEQMRERLLNIRDLGVLKDKAETALEAIDDATTLLPAVPAAEQMPDIVAVFMGMQDDDLAVKDEIALRERFKKRIDGIRPNNERVFALAGASPAEIVFHEICENLLLNGVVALVTILPSSGSLTRTGGPRPGYRDSMN